MNMNNKLLGFILFFVLLFVCSGNVYADDVLPSCNTFSESQCALNRRCKWNPVESNCQDVYLAADPCSDTNILRTMNFFGYLLLIARVAIPLIIIVIGSIDLFKSVIDKDEKSFTKQIKTLGMRVVAGVFVFFIPTLIYALFSISTQLNIVEDERYEGCVQCLLEPTECNIN